MISTGIDLSTSHDSSAVNMQNDNFNIDVKDNEISISIKKKENHTIEDLIQEIINDQYPKIKAGCYNSNLIKMVLDYYS